MLFKSQKFIDCVFGRIEKRQNESQNGYNYLKLRTINKSSSSLFEKQITSAKIFAGDLPKLIEFNFAGQIKKLYISIPEHEYYIDEFRYLQKKYLENLKYVKLFKVKFDDPYINRLLYNYKGKHIRIKEDFELNGINFKFEKFLEIIIYGKHNVLIKNSKFQGIDLKCHNNLDVKILNTQFLKFFIDGCRSSYIENIKTSGNCRFRDITNTCNINNISISPYYHPDSTIHCTVGRDDLAVMFENCKNFQIYNACILWGYGNWASSGENCVWISNSSGKIKDCILKKYTNCGIVSKCGSEVYFRNIKFEGTEGSHPFSVSNNSSFIQDD